MRRPDAVDGHGLQGDARSLAICRDASERRGEAHALLWLGRVELQADDSRAARHWLGHLLFTFRDFQMREELAQCLEDHAQLAFLDGRLDSAVLLAGAAHAIADAMISGHRLSISGSGTPG